MRTALNRPIAPSIAPTVGISMGGHAWRRACLVALALLAGCQARNAEAPARSAPAATEPAAAPAATEPAAAPAPAEPAPDEAASGAPAPAPAPHEPDEAASGAPAPDPAAAPAPAPVATPTPAPPVSAPPASAPPRAAEERANIGGGKGPQGSKQAASGGYGSRPSAGVVGHANDGSRPSAGVPADDGRGQRPRDAVEVEAGEGQAAPVEAPPEPQPEPPPPAPPESSVEAFYASLPEQAIAFHVPRTVPRNQTFAVRLVVRPGHSEAELARVIVDIVSDAGPAPAPDDVRTRTTKIGDEMQARISSPTLQIVARGEDRQLVRRDAVTEWVWDVTATTAGSHRLTLSLYAVPQGRGSGVKVKTFEETLTVEVAFIDEIKETVADNWEWMWTFVLGPVGALAWRRRQRRHAQGV